MRVKPSTIWWFKDEELRKIIPWPEDFGIIIAQAFKDLDEHLAMREQAWAISKKLA